MRKIRRRDSRNRLSGYTIVEVLIAIFGVGALALGVALAVALIRFLWISGG